MKTNRMILFVIILIAISMVFSGCGGTGTSTVKANAFGKTQKDTSVLSNVKAKFGELGKASTPRILNPILTTQIVEFFPVNQVSSYNKGTPVFTLWFIYDSFADGDTGVITWKYLDTNEVIATDDIALTSSADAKYGRYIANIQAPDGGWPTGKYSVTISAKGVSAALNFDVIDGATVTSGFDLANEAATPATPTASASGSSIYSDVNYPFSVGVYEDYKANVKSGDVIFSSNTKEMYYIAEVIKTKANGGLFSKKEQVASDYYGRFSMYSPEFLGEGTKTVNGKTCLDTSVKYTADSVTYTNRFIICDGGDYFYVLQFVIPQTELSADSALIERIISSFKFEVNGVPNTDSGANTQETVSPSASSNQGSETSESQAASAEECYSASKTQIENAFAANAAATTWDSYWVNLNYYPDCNTQFRTCADAKDLARYYDPLTVSGQGSPELAKLEVEMIRLCYNREVACNEFEKKKECGIANPVLKTFPKISEQTCNDAYNAVMQTYRDYNILANMGNPLPPAKRLDDCYYPYQRTCVQAATDANHACQATVTNSDYTACNDGYANSILKCVTDDIDCHAAFYRENCKTIAQI